MSIVDIPEDQPWRPSGKGAAIAAQAAARNQLQADELNYIGNRWTVFWITLSRMILTIITAGIGRFWMSTRLRRHYWSSVEIGGAPLEYTGTAIEKLIGFLIAVAVLAVYLVAVNLALTFVGLSYFQGNFLALQLPLIALVPFIPWAQYRARRYIMARTRWRGIRFGMAPGAWGYTGRYLFWALVSLLSLGLLYPLMQLRLSRFATARSYYGDLRFEQRGALGPLLKRWLFVWAPVPLALIAVGVAGANGELDNPTTVSPALGTAVFVGYLWVFLAGVYYQVFTFRYLSSHKVLADRTWFEFRLGFWPVVGIYLFGGIAIQIGVLIIAALCSGVAFAVLTAFGLDFETVAPLLEGEMPDVDAMFATILLFAAYLPAIAAGVALSQAFITHPLLAKIAGTTRIHGLEHAGRARQRAHDEQAEAGGFADALGADVGGAF